MKHRFGGVDIAKAAHFCLVQQKLLETSCGAVERLPQVFGRKLVGERFRSEFRDRAILHQFGRIDHFHQPEMPLVLEHKPRATVETEYGMREFRIFRFGRQQHEPAAHSQMRKEGSTVIEIEKYVLAAAVDEIYPALPKLFREDSRCRIGREPRTQQLGRFDPSSADRLVKGSCDELYLG